MIGGWAALLAVVPLVGAFVAGTPSASFGSSRPPLKLCGLTGDSPQDLLRQVRAMPSAKRIGESDRFLTYAVASGSMTWTFTKAADAAHPAVACRTIARRSDGSLTVSTQFVCGAPQRACDRLKDEFAELDRRMKADIAKDIRAQPQ